MDRIRATMMAHGSSYAYADPPGTRMAESSAYRYPPGTRMAESSAYIRPPPPRGNIKIYSDGKNQDFCLACYDTMPSMVREKLNLNGHDSCRLCSRRSSCSHYFWCDICGASGIHFGETTQIFVLLQKKKTIDYALLQSNTDILELLLKDIISRYPDHPPTSSELLDKLRADSAQGGFGYNHITANTIVSLYMSFLDMTLLPGGYKEHLRDPRK